MDWKKEIIVRQEQMIEDLSQLLSIESVKDDASKSDGAPMGENIHKALSFMLDIAREDGFRTKNIDGYAGFAEMGPKNATDYIAILCHLDVVPATGEWDSDPFTPEIRNGRLYARGAIDDKGPTMAAYYAMKAVKESGLALKHRVRIIFGTDEESGMSCMKRYTQTEPEALTGFAPDAEFPIIHAEKGQINATLIRKAGKPVEAGNYILSSFYAGEKGNMVPDRAEVIINGVNLDLLRDEFIQYGQRAGLQVESHNEGDSIRFILYGKSAHGMEPDKGINAATKLACFLNGKLSSPFLRFAADCLDEDFHGEKLEISFSDEVTGPLTVNPGIFRLKENEESIALNIRCPVETPYLRTIEKLSDTAANYGFKIEEVREKKPHYVDKDRPVIKALQQAYEEETGHYAGLLTTGGATYARFITNGVAFGAVFPGKDNTAHQRNEYAEIADLLKAASIYARAIYSLAKI
ncbi:dipeptidase PepV [Bacillus sp. UMB0728]|uniref:dipeptidase PepV n=1 Tax=Bacillus sp. UMB0728 TaxID=2066052 RepID=UPI000C77FC15|nr:dipeptidase PepV [Bacillus sp. UMB0728]PLR73167.1 dipeptidase PepV [Bacillus sp. UMB0728]